MGEIEVSLPIHDRHVLIGTYKEIVHIMTKCLPGPSAYQDHNYTHQHQMPIRTICLPRACTHRDPMPTRTICLQKHVLTGTVCLPRQYAHQHQMPTRTICLPRPCTHWDQMPTRTICQYHYTHYNQMPTRTFCLPRPYTH